MTGLKMADCERMVVKSKKEQTMQEGIVQEHGWIGCLGGGVAKRGTDVRISLAVKVKNIELQKAMQDIVATPETGDSTIGQIARISQI
jgi:hypothetical protein